MNQESTTIRQRTRPTLYTPEQMREHDAELIEELRAELRSAITSAERKRAQADIDRVEARLRG